MNGNYKKKAKPRDNKTKTKERIIFHERIFTVTFLLVIFVVGVRMDLCGLACYSLL